MRLPDFFIAGAARSGTTALWRCLCQHPSIYMPATLGEKEPCHFCHHGFIRDRDAYLRLFCRARPEQLVGEASTYYLNCPETPGLIRAEIPQAKFIFILRQPADRAYSLYNWMLAEGYEREYPFEKALAAE
ncbi:MAG: sulfotransferase domain-containing protein, partial [Planctomycetota bacterium]|nr:sulfotransferase domain-containing protein [Planctomycetota bacterium]